MLLRLVGVEPVDKRLLESLPPILRKHLGFRSCVVGPFIEPPPSSFNPHRGQYDADLILDRLLKCIKGRFLAVTSCDLYSSSHNLNFIFGQATCPGRGAVLSTCRLDPKFYGLPENPSLLLQRVCKEAIHELGHTFGLAHCSNKGCVMSFSNSVAEVDWKSGDFCKACSIKLEGLKFIVPP